MWFVDDFLETADHESEAKWNKYQTSQPHSNELQFLLAPFGSPEQFQKPRRRFVLRNAATSRNIRPQHSNLLIAYSRAEISTSGASVWKVPIPIPYVCSRPQGIKQFYRGRTAGPRFEERKGTSLQRVTNIFSFREPYSYGGNLRVLLGYDSKFLSRIDARLRRNSPDDKIGRTALHVSDLRWANFFDLSRTCFLETHGNTILACENWEEDFASHQLRFEERVKRLLNFFFIRLVFETKYSRLESTNGSSHRIIGSGGSANQYKNSFTSDRLTGSPL